MTATPDRILHNGRVWTVDQANPTAQAVSIKGNRLSKVGSNDEILATAGPGTEMVDLDGNFVLPGLIDAHTHLENAARGFFDLRLNNTDSLDRLMQQLASSCAVVPKNFWITGGEWSATAGRAAGKRGERYESFFPNLHDVDRLAPDRPLLLKRFDGSYFVNTFGLKLFHVSRSTPDPAGGAYQRGPDGELTGVLFGTAGSRAAHMLPPENRARLMVGARAMIDELKRFGITGIHDIARVPSISERQVFPTNVERSASDVTIFEELRTDGDLQVRVSPILTLRTWEELDSVGITPGSGDDLIRYQTLKMFVGGFLMFREFANQPGFAGSLSFRNRDEGQLRDELIAADAAGWDVAVHVTGDKGHALVVEGLEAAIGANPVRTRRHRILHAWYPRHEEIARAGALGVFGDITPYHLIREMGSIADKLYPDQLDSAFAWRDMMDAGWTLNIVSDWPGSFDGSHPAPLNPLENIYLAVSRRAPDSAGPPFHPDQGLSVDDAIRSYTINPARAGGEDAIKGSITPGKLADLVVLSDDIRSLEIDKLPSVGVVMTVFDGIPGH